MHQLTIQNNSIFLDGANIQGIKEYELKSSANTSGVAELTLKLVVSTSNPMVNQYNPLNIDSAELASSVSDSLNRGVQSMLDGKALGLL